MSGFCQVKQTALYLKLSKFYGAVALFYFYMRKERFNSDSLYTLLPRLTQTVPEGVLNRAIKDGQFELPRTGPGRYSLPNALRKLQGPFKFTK